MPNSEREGTPRKPRKDSTPADTATALAEVFSKMEEREAEREHKRRLELEQLRAEREDKRQRREDEREEKRIREDREFKFKMAQTEKESVGWS